ncbi:MAG TPA: hypothetical protein VIP11_01615 [Gemmatimonadaceae bacterium]
MMMRSFIQRAARLALVAAVLAPFTAGAQASLSGQGFGFPTGQFSSRAQGTGGSVAEMDPLSPVNPATIGAFQTKILFFQLEPEYRSVTTIKGTEHTNTARYPLVFGALPIGRNWVFSLGSSSLLDRTSTSAFQSIQVLNGVDSVPMTTTYHIDGGINDVRLAAAWSPRNWLRLGVGAHAITGRNLVDLTQTFEDTTKFQAFAQQIQLGYSGSAVSGGVQVTAANFTLAASARFGGNLRVSNEDTVLARAKVPNLFGGSIAYVGLANSAFAVRTSYSNWSEMGDLGNPGLNGVNGWDTSFGADIAGPRIGNRIVFLRAGGRTRTLPFQAAGETVRENSVSGGIGTGFGNGRVLTDLALIRSFRKVDFGATERAWTLSFGIGVRP